MGEKYGFIDIKGNFVIPEEFDQVDIFSEGMARIKIGKLWGYINEQGVIVIKPKYIKAKNFSSLIINNKIAITDYKYHHKQQNSDAGDTTVQGLL